MYLFAPLDEHYDKGFGAVADSFQDAATALKEQYNRGRLNGHLPICYLFRHSIELFLKGAIIIVHQGLKIPYGKEPYTSERKIQTVNKKDISIYETHDIDLLYKYLSSLLTEKKDELEDVFNDWKFSDNFGSKIEQLKNWDSSSTYFRYPTDKKQSIFEKKKSAFKETTVKDVMALAIKNQEPMKSMKVVSLIGRDTQIFIHDDSFTEEAMNLLAEVADEVSACHFALMNKIGGGVI
ncbi:MAG: hypothetical protein K2P61_10645 [Burkholderiaceae bacterium]|nr:hypothetical protein [Burkholderiaceae bacterium]